GDTSTNDTLYLLASGSSGVAVSGEEDLVRLAAGLARVCGSLALQIVADGEGATKLATVQVTGGRDGLQVERVAAAICRSPLVKTALFGQDANWGRIVAAAGAVG
ncbi:MAG TPA: bifunctional ornithine acetyltransferase/N-acetylglutamate synthase, partial [Proteobacteria bacterium]|nr:bifunctional ornithine acetyltransferase/N-acetylglutamate synthase [Pseudomonadota bacterium]